jgi:biotin carboxyl carrier protein
MRVEVRGKDGRYFVTIDGTPLEVDVAGAGPHFASLLIDGRSHEVGLEKRPGGYAVHFPDDTVAVDLADAAPGTVGRPKRDDGPARLAAPMPGRVVRVLVSEGTPVESGQGLVVVEAMKMENELRAPRKGRVRQIAVHEGQAVDAGALLVVVD